uniref:CSON005786 protein n=1 Tax=Culicoides sonorensis TaxID=179676 RepID=A0A336N0U5_CULSO
MTHFQFPPSLYYMQEQQFHNYLPSTVTAGMQHYSISNQYPISQHLQSQTTVSIPINNYGCGLPNAGFNGTNTVMKDIEEKMDEDNRTNITNLYPEILTMIFSKLDLQSKGRVAQVCNGWRDAVYAKSCWKGIEAKLHLRKGSQALFSSLIKRGIRRVHILSLKRSLKDVVVSLPNLESLNLSGTYNITDVAITQAFSIALPNLRVLDLSLCKQVTDASIGQVSHHVKNLEVLDLAGCGNITNTGLLLIAWGLKNLKRLNLRSCWHISDQGIGHLAGMTKDKADGTVALEYLGLQDCQHLTDEALKCIADGLQSLKSINLSFCVSITDQGLKHLNKMPCLEALNLSACDNITDMGIAYLTEGVTTLVTLEMSFCDKIGDTALNYIANTLFHLKQLSLNACRITDTGLIRVARAIHELEVLNIGQCSAITDQSILVLSETLQNLRAIDIYGCTKITSEGLSIIVKLPKLEHLNLGLWHKR